MALSLTLWQNPAFGMLEEKSPSGSQPSQDPSAPAQPPQTEYAPGELIVKLKPGYDLSSIRELNQQLGVKQVQEIFPKVTSPEDRLEELKAKRAGLEGKEHPGWYWWKDKESADSKDYEARLAKEKEELERQTQGLEEQIRHLEQRQARAPEGMEPPELTGTYLLKGDEKLNVPQAAAAYEKSPAVEYAEPNYEVRIQEFPQTLPNDTYVDPDQNGTWSMRAWGQSYEDLWGLKKIQANKAWPLSQGEGVIVAVTDTGVDYTHEDLAQNIWTNPGEVPGNGKDDDGNGYVDDVRGWDFAYNDNDPKDEYGHGSHVAGTIAAAGNNRKGVIGVAPQAKIMAVKFLDDSGSGTLAAAASAVRYAVDNGADVTNNSWGGSGTSQLLEDAFNYAYSKGVISLAAAGNSNADVKGFFPARFATVMAIAATNQDDQKTSFSNFGLKVDVSAPGGGYDNEAHQGIYNILSALPEGSAIASGFPELKAASGYYRLAGTSMACPHVAGLAASVLSKFPGLSVAEARVRIMATADPILQIPDQPIGQGRINAHAALTAAPRPFLRLKGVRLEEKQGNGNQVPESGEEIALIIELENIWKDAFQVTGYLRSEGPAIPSIPVSVSEFGSIVRGQVRDNRAAPFVFKIGSIQFETPAECTLTVHADGSSQTMRFKVRLGVRRLAPFSLSHLVRHPIHFSGDKVVWHGLSPGEDDYYHVFLYDLTNHKQTQLSRPESIHHIAPTVSGDKVVWAETNFGASPPAMFWDLYVYDLTTQQKRRITFSPRRRESPAKISGSQVVWAGQEDGDIFVYDLATGQQRNLTADSAWQIQPDIHEDRIVWTDYRNAIPSYPNLDIYSYDLNLNREQPVTTEPHLQSDPSVWGNKVVYQDTRNPEGGIDIYLSDLETGSERALVTDLGNQLMPRLSGNRMVYSHHGPGGYAGVFLYDLTRGSKRRVTVYPSFQWNAQIDGNRIVWMDFTEKAIYFAEAEATSNRPPVAGSIRPGRGSSKGNHRVTFTTTFSDPDGWQDIAWGRFIVNDPFQREKGFFGYYDQNQNKLYLRNDNNTAWLGGLAPGSGQVIETDRVRLHCAQTEVSGGGDELTIRWRITFKPRLFRGFKKMYLKAKDDSGEIADWIEKGSWTIH